MYENQKPSLRLNWIDSAKGFIILWVILYQCLLRVVFTLPEANQADLVNNHFVAYFAEFGRPMRMPALFMFSGILVGKAINLPWREYFHKKIYHLIFFFILWTAIQICLKNGLKGNFIAIPFDIIFALIIEPQNSLWFIGSLAIFLVVIKLIYKAPKLIIIIFAAVLEIAKLYNYSIFVDNSSRYFIYFVLGFYYIEQIKTLSLWIEKNIFAAFFIVLSYVFINIYMISTSLWAERAIGLAHSIFSLLAIIAFGIIIEKSRLLTNIFADFFTFFGRHSLVFYLGYAIFMILINMIILKIVPFLGINTQLLTMWILSIISAYILWQLSLKFNFRFLFERQ